MGTNIHHGPVDGYALSTFSVEFRAMVTQRFSAGAGTQILGLDIVAFGAPSIVMMDILLHGMPRTLAGHGLPLPSARIGGRGNRTPPC